MDIRKALIIGEESTGKNFQELWKTNNPNILLKRKDY